MTRNQFNSDSYVDSDLIKKNEGGLFSIYQADVL